MKRIGGNIFNDIISVENLIAADIFAREDKDCTRSIARWDRNWAANIAKLHDELREMVYKPGGYSTFKTSKADSSAKVREISVCVNYRDRIVHQAVIQVLSKYITTKFILHTYASIPKRGTHLAIFQIKELLAKKGELFCLKLDIEKFYPNINGDIMIKVLGRVVKCSKTLWLLSEIVRSAKNMPIGNLTSQWFGNLYLSELDHYAKETLKAKHYYRYCDDVVIFDPDRDRLRRIEASIRIHLRTERNLKINKSWAIFKVGKRKGDGRGLDYLGYVMFCKHTELRKSSKLRWRRKLKMLNKAPPSIYDVQAAGSLHGILKHCDSENLLKTFKNDYPEYFARLRDRQAAKRAANRLRSKKVEVVLSPDTDHTRDAG